MNVNKIILGLVALLVVLVIISYFDIPGLFTPTNPENPEDAFALTHDYASGRVYFQSQIQYPGMNPEAFYNSSQFSPSLELFCGGTRWAAHNGARALFITWIDNYNAHHLTDGTAWGPWPDLSWMESYTTNITKALQTCGFSVNASGDIPQDLSGYDVVVFSAYWAITPENNQQMKNYLLSGGGIVLLEGTPAYFCAYSKNFEPYKEAQHADLIDWIGGNYTNADGKAIATVDHPFGTSIRIGALLVESYGWNAAETASSDSTVIVKWRSAVLLEPS